MGEGGEGGITGRVEEGGGRRGGGEMLYFSASFCELVRLRVVVVVGGEGRGSTQVWLLKQLAEAEQLSGKKSS